MRNLRAQIREGHYIYQSPVCEIVADVESGADMPSRLSTHQRNSFQG